jgi:hypothetical protein
MIWREKRVLLIVLGVILLANTVFFFTYRVQYKSRLETMDERLAQAQARLDEARRARATAETRLKGYAAVEKDIAVVYDQYWSTQSARLTEMIGEVKRLAVASSLVPTTYSFDLQEAKSGERRGAEVGAVEMGVSFGVNGTYAQVRRLMNLLELSNQFVIVDRIALSAAEGDVLSLTLHLKTLFRDGAAESQPKSRL